MKRFVACLTIAGLAGLSSPVLANAPASRLQGSIVAASGTAAMAGARLFAADPLSGEIFDSGPADAGGRFSLELPPATYEIGVQIDDGLYLVGTPVELAPGQSEDVLIQVKAGARSAPPTRAAAVKPSVWNNPLTAALIVLGAAVVVGVLVEDATDDEDSASPFGP